MIRSLALLSLALAACAPAGRGGDDDDTTAAADDDDAVADDDDATPVDIDCDDATLEPIVEAIHQWSLIESCTTARLSVGPADQGTMISLYWLITEPIVQDASWALYFGGEEPGDAVPGTDGLLRGSDLMTNECSANPTANPVTNEAWSFTGGTARITVTGTGAGSGWTGRVDLTDAVVTLSASTSTCHVPDITWDGLTFGRPPD
jgi:hypothetical protein